MHIQLRLKKLLNVFGLCLACFASCNHSLAHDITNEVTNEFTNKITHEIILWHSMDGPLNETFQSLIDKFNRNLAANNPNVKAKVVPIFKGTYEETLALGLKAVESKQAPHILQVFEMGNLVMQNHPQAFVPIDKLTEKPNPNLSPNHFLPIIRAFYKSPHPDRGMLSLPFSASSVILFYNKDALRRAGFDPEQPPKTWEDFETMAIKLKSQGAKNVMASGWLSGHHIDHLAAWHNEPIATKGNGIDGRGATLIINRPFFVHHLNKLAEWYAAGIFSLETRLEAEKVFANEEVIFLSQGSNRLPLLEKLVNGKFEIGVGQFPYWKSKVKAPQNTVAGGASFFALSGFSPEEYKIIARLFEFLASPEVQAEWHEKTCYMPVVIGAEAIAAKQNFYSQGLKGKAAKLALDSFQLNSPREYSRGVLLPNFPKVREMMVYEMKEAIRGNKTAIEALASIEESGNKIMTEDLTY